MNRHCTDIFCCMAFIIFICGFVAASGYGFMNGRPELLTIGWDSDRNGCGWNTTTKDYPYLYWPQAPTTQMIEDLSKGNVDDILDLFNTGTCVKTCPEDESKPIDCHITQKMRDDSNYQKDGITQCAYMLDATWFEKNGIDLDKYRALLGDAAVDAQKYEFRYPTTAVGGFCSPKLEKEQVEEFAELGKELSAAFFDKVLGDEGGKILADIGASWKVIAISAVTALILGYLFLFIIRCIGGAIIYLSLLLILACFVGGGLYVMEYAKVNIADDDPYKQYANYAAYVLFGLAALELVCVCCCWKAIKIAVAVYKTTAQYVASNLRILVLPLFSWVILGIWGLTWLFCAVHVYSVGDIAQREAPLEFMTGIKWSDTTRYAMWYQLFGLLWVAAFVNGLCQFIIAASTCIWYFTVNSDTKGRGTVGTAFYWGFRYHLGSIAFGSFCIAVVQMIRLIFEWYRRKIAKASRDSKVVKALLCLTSYCLYLLEKCVKFISKNAYIQVALTNDHFCKAAWNAFSLIIANAARFGWATNVGSILTAFGVVAIGAVNGFLAYLALTMTEIAPEVQNPIAPVVLVAFLSLMIANTFLAIFGFSSDAILQSFLLDESLRFAGANRPEHMQEFAQSFTGNKGCC